MATDRAAMAQRIRTEKAATQSTIYASPIQLDNALSNRAETLEWQSRDQVDNLASQQHEQLRQHTELITALVADKTALDSSIEHLCPSKRLPLPPDALSTKSSTAGGQVACGKIIVRPSSLRARLVRNLSSD
jgi:hypothetical protein